jgi:hypothetical protein
MNKSAFFTIVLLLAYAAYAQERKNACTKYDETHLDACASGREAVWAYDFSDPEVNGGQTVQSWGFKNTQAAERDRDFNKKWCDIIARWDHTSCRNAYGEPYCAACAPGAIRQGALSQEQQVWLEKSNLVIERWELQSARAIIKFASENPQPNPYSSVGSVLRDYTSALRDALKDLIRLRRAMQQVYTGVKGFTANIQPAIDALQNDENRIDTADANYQQSGLAPPPANYGTAGNWMDESVTVGGNRISQVINVSGDEVVVSQRAGSAAPGRTETWSVSSGALRIATLQIGQFGGYYSLTFTLRPGNTARHTQQFGSGRPITSNEQRVEMDFQAEADARAAAATLCPGGTF